MTKLCPRGKAAAKRKFKVYPSAYANAYASKICAGKIKDPSGVKRKDFRGPKPAGKAEGGRIKQKRSIMGTGPRGLRRPRFGKTQPTQRDPSRVKIEKPKRAKPIEPQGTMRRRENKMGGGMMQMPRAMYGKGGGVCKRGMGRAYGKNS